MDKIDFARAMAATTGLSPSLENISLGTNNQNQDEQEKKAPSIDDEIADTEEEVSETEKKVEAKKMKNKVICGHYYAARHDDPLCTNHTFRNADFTKRGTSALKACVQHMRHCPDNKELRLCDVEGCDRQLMKSNESGFCFIHRSLAEPNKPKKRKLEEMIESLASSIDLLTQEVSELKKTRV
jgi:septal ring factor EnvC (AmiA/AmiB activator)